MDLFDIIQYLVLFFLFIWPIIKAFRKGKEQTNKQPGRPTRSTQRVEQPVGQVQRERPYAQQELETEPLQPDYTEYQTLEDLQRQQSAASQYQDDRQPAHQLDSLENPLDPPQGQQSQQPGLFESGLFRRREYLWDQPDAATPQQSPQPADNPTPESLSTTHSNSLESRALAQGDHDLVADSPKLDSAYAYPNRPRGAHPLRQALRKPHGRKRAIQWLAVLNRPTHF